nr:hypothetical protein - jelly fungus (Trimorphomyces papilionaceus) [Trimorphomyces papilionaceus]
MLPSHHGNMVCGWSNYPGNMILILIVVVTTHEIYESRMGYRVSKSDVQKSVKEQRVDGSCCNTNSSMQLRCTLTSHENGNLTEILSNPGNNNASINSVKPSLPVDPWAITGFTDAEGSFMLKIAKLVRVQLEFCIGLHVKDLALLKAIQRHFGVGNIRVSGNTAYFSVKRLDDILNVVIPFFDKYPLQTAKSADYLLFKQRALLMQEKHHLKNILNFVAIKASINWD